MSVEDIVPLLVYDETSPSCLRWKFDRFCGNNYNRTRVKAGDVAGHLESIGYYRVALGNDKFSVHRVIWYMFYGYLPDVVDHIDGDTTNNKITNLREANRILNTRNCKMDKRNSSGVTGVNLYSKNINGKDYSYWRATWRSLDGKPFEKYFSVYNYGYDEAFHMACEYREKMIAELNTNGAGYTERHGT